MPPPRRSTEPATRAVKLAAPTSRIVTWTRSDSRRCELVGGADLDRVARRAGCVAPVDGDRLARRKLPVGGGTEERRRRGAVMGGGVVTIVEAGFTSNVETTKPFPILPPIFDERGLATLLVVTTNDAEVAPAGTSTVGGTVATVVSVLTRGTTPVRRASALV